MSSSRSRIVRAAAALLPALAACACASRPPGPQMDWREAVREDVTIRYGVIGEGPTVVMLPSLGRGAEDFFDLAGALARAGYRVALPQPRGIDGSLGPMAGLTLHDLAGDVETVIERLGGKPVVIVGHAFGNRVARTVASDYPESVDKVVLLAAGGMVPIAPEPLKALRACFDLSLPDEERLKAIKLAFFAEGNDPSVWLGGWHPDVANAQTAAAQATPLDEWSAAGSAQILVIQAAEDTIAPPRNAELLAEKAGGRVTIKTLDRAGHAMLPERPDEIARMIIEFLK